MDKIVKILKIIGKYTVYCFVFMVNPKSVIFREVDDELAESKKTEI